MKIRVLVYARSDEGASFERKLTLPFPPFPGLLLALGVGGSIVDFRVTHVHWHEELTFGGKNLTVLFIDWVGNKDAILGREEFEDHQNGARWILNTSVTWPS